MSANYTIALIAAAYVGVISIIGFLAFAWDKHCAVQNTRRIPESELLSIAFIGGIVGSIAAQHLLRHKTRKQPFKSFLYGIAALQVLLILALSFPDMLLELSDFL
ncbi:DUF1294 domain-containing protein [Sneathiella sp. CAU 1612]|uniref:DUF1294 domain-containing protein n=1 Tax=Sneathiella sedimenti TaxID=2816034 RepID=A0ABS3F8U2_9PROT|nr:DUF1294 domain-containing protein [Sneathiella sedimenti]MBO0334939.1 DUF1294 domain-containing protein [Sneathiella sedimenti]